MFNLQGKRLFLTGYYQASFYSLSSWSAAGCGTTDIIQKNSVEASSKGYIPVSGTVVQYGEQYYVPQQPPQVPFAREPPVYTEERQFQSQEYEESRYYPPPYDYIERKSPSAPPEGQ